MGRRAGSTSSLFFSGRGPGQAVSCERQVSPPLVTPFSPAALPSVFAWQRSRSRTSPITQPTYRRDSLRGTASPAEDPLPAGAGAQPLLAAVPALLLLSPALTSPEKLAFIVSQSERVRSPARGNGTSPLLLSLAVGNWGIFVFFSLLFEFLQGPGAEGAMLPCAKRNVATSGLRKDGNLRCRF